MTKLRFARDGYILISILFYITAVCYMALPVLPTKWLCWVSGGILLAYGIIKIVGFFSGDLYCLAFQDDLALGILMLILGLGLLIFNLRVADFIPVGAGWLALLDSLFKVQMSRDAKSFGLRQWKVILGVGLLTAVLSVVLIFFCHPSTTWWHYITGVVLLAEGVMNHCVVLFTVKRMIDE